MTTKKDRGFHERLKKERGRRKKALLCNPNYTSCMNNTKWVKWFESIELPRIEIKKVLEDEVVVLSEISPIVEDTYLECEVGCIECWEIEWAETENEKILGYHRVTQ